MTRNWLRGWGLPLAAAFVLMLVGGLVFAALLRPTSNAMHAPQSASSSASPTAPSLPNTVPSLATTTPTTPLSTAPPPTAAASSQTVVTPSAPAVDQSTTAASPTDRSSAATSTPAVDCSVVKCVALTFDDGPGPSTPSILKTLAKKSVTATFFVQGYRVEQYGEYVQQAAAAGHVIGNHSYDHRDFTKLSTKAVKSQINRTNRAVQSITGQAPTLVRPPYGAINDTVRKTVNAPLIMWNVDTLDWKYKSGRRIMKYVKAQTHNGSIILMHDIQPGTAKHLVKVIDWLRAKGYHFVTVPQLFDNHLTNGKVYYGR